MRVVVPFRHIKLPSECAATLDPQSKALIMPRTLTNTYIHLLVLHLSACLPACLLICLSVKTVLVPHNQLRCNTSLGLNPASVLLCAYLPACLSGCPSAQYEAVRRWVTQHGTDPTTLTPLSILDVHPNLLIREMVERWLAGSDPLAETDAAD